jgi:hypothetical protein
MRHVKVMLCSYFLSLLVATALPCADFALLCVVGAWNWCELGTPGNGFLQAIKPPARSIEKALTCYGGDVSRLLDGEEQM